MRLGDKKIFLNKVILLEMIALRRAGYATTTLAILFGVDRSSIEYHCQRFQVKPNREVYTLESILKDVIRLQVPRETQNWRIVNGEKINVGKTYKEYLLSP